MNIIVLDFETYFDDEYSLKKMSTEAYIRDPRFKAHGAAIRWPGTGKTTWFHGDDLTANLNNIPWDQTACMCWHAQFDLFILNHHYGIRPKFILCPMSMARLMLGNHVSVSLDSVRKHFNLSPKTTPYNLFKGRYWDEMPRDVKEEVADGACDEVESIWKIFNLLMRGEVVPHNSDNGRPAAVHANKTMPSSLGVGAFPKQELQIIDQTIRLFTEPKLRGDIDLLAKLWESENDRKVSRLDSLGVGAGDLQSSDRFADLLRAEGVEPEEKEGKNGPIYAFAKTDQFMRDLLEHDAERVRALAEARLGVKSTLLQTRAATLGWMARRGSMPVYLRYCGARTLRDSGGDGANWQNFKRGSDIRKAIMAPEGYLLAPIDASQIECRVLNYLAEQEDVVERFRKNEDPYVGIASEFYGRRITKDDPLERGTGKQAELSCGYGCGPPKFRDTAKLGIYGPPVDLRIEEATRFVKLYRDTHRKVTDYWHQAELTLRKMRGGLEFDWGIFHVKDKRIYVEGRPLIYDTLERHNDEETGEAYWRVKTRNGWEKLYGAKLVQNLCEAVSRLIVFQAGLRIQAMGYPILCRTHDELLILLAKDGQEEYKLQECMTEMRRTPDWLPGIPLDCEGHLGMRYSK